jgi:hypothetical protein
MVADGPTIPADGPTVVIHSRELVIEYPLRDWNFDVDRPSMSSGITLQSLGDGRYRISPPGAAGDHVVWITGQDVDDPRSGASLVFRWVVSDE